MGGEDERAREAEARDEKAREAVTRDGKSQAEKARHGKAPDEKASNEKVLDEKGRAPPPPAGPHDRPDLINPDATPGSGILPSPDDDTGETDPAAG